MALGAVWWLDHAGRAQGRERGSKSLKFKGQLAVTRTRPGAAQMASDWRFWLWWHSRKKEIKMLPKAVTL